MEETQRSVSCKSCNSTSWISATPLGRRNYQKFKCKCRKTVRILTLKWGKTLQFSSKL